MIYRKNRKYTYSGIALVLIWALLCPEIYMQEQLPCLERADGKPICEEEARRVWEELYSGEIQQDDIVYKIGFIEWLKEQNRMEQ